VGLRGPKPGGLVSTVVKLPPGVRAALLDAAARRKRNLSEEVRHRLQYSLRDPEDDRTQGLMWLLAAAVRSTIGRRKMSSWLDDPSAYDEALAAINTVLEAIRPPGAIEGAGRLHGAFAARGTMADLQRAPALPPVMASRHRQEMVEIRQAIGGNVVDRAMIHGKTAEQVRADKPARLELVALRKKEALSVQGKGQPLTNQEGRRLKALIARLVAPAHHVTRPARPRRQHQQPT
jgi:hypothetical protein